MIDSSKEFKKYANKHIGISSMTLHKYTSAYGNYINPTITEENTDTVFGAFGGWAGNGLRIGFEYHTSDHDNFDSASSYTGSLSSVYLTYAINDNLSVIARTDDRNPDDDSTVVTDDASTEIFGLIWTPVEGLSVCPNVTKTTLWSPFNPNSVGDDSVSDVALNFQFKF